MNDYIDGLNIMNQQQKEGYGEMSRPSSSPTNLHDRILAIAQSLMDEHYLLDGEKLHAQCVRALKDVDRFSLDAALEQLFQSKILVRGKAVTKETLFDNQNRQRLYNYIKNNPGINLNKLCKILPINWGTIKWHVKMLEIFAMIKPVKIDDHTVLFDTSINQHLFKGYYVLNKKNIVEILDCIYKNPGLTITEIVDRINLSRSNTFRKVKYLIESGFLTTRTLENGQIVISGFYPQYEEILKARINEPEKYENITAF